MLPLKFLCALWAVLLLAPNAFADTPAAAVTMTRAHAAASTPQPVEPPHGVHRVTTIQGVTQYQLSNGLTILLAADDSRAQTTVNMSYKVGSSNEGPGEAGMAHLLEHLMFRGSSKHPDTLAEFSRRGLAANGSTTVDLTNYYASFASDPDTLRWYLAWQADAMRTTHITQQDLDAELTVVRNELERGENSPFSMLMQQVTAAAYVWHPYGRSTIGTVSDLAHVDLGQLRAFYQRYYQPDNAVLIVTGQFDPQQVLQWIVDDFGAMRRPTRSLDPIHTVEPVQQGARAITLERQGNSPIALVQYHVPEATSSVFTAVSIGSDMLADAPAGPLYQALVKTGKASSVFGFARPLKQPGYALFGAQLQPGADVRAVLKILEDQLEGGAVAALDPAALNRVKTAWLNDWKQTYNQPAALAQALSSAVSQGDWRLFFIRPLQVRALTLEQVKAQLNQWLLPSNRTSGLYLPTHDPHYAPAAPAADLPHWIAKLETDTPRPATIRFDARPAAIDQATQRITLALANGPVKLALLPKATAGHEVNAYLQLRFGDASELRGLGMIPSVTAAMLLRGAQGMSRQEIDDRLNALDSSLSFSGDGNVLTIRMRSDRRHFTDLLELTFHLLRTPTFPPEELDRIKSSLSTSIENNRTNPAWLARNTLERLDQPWQDDDVRYTPDANTLAADVKGLTADLLQNFYQRFYGAGNISLAAVGDFDPQRAQQALQDGLKGWSRAPQYARITDPWYPVTPQTLHIATPGKANANYLAQRLIQIQDTDPRWPALMLANYLLGGSEDSRLWQRVRATEGLSYSVGSALDVSSWEPSGAWTLFASMAPRNTASLERAIRETLQQTLQDGFTQAEVDQGAKSLIHFLQLGRSSDRYLASRWLDYLQTDRSFAWQSHIQDRLQSLTKEDVDSALRTFLKPQDLAIAIAADPGNASPSPARPGTTPDTPETGATPHTPKTETTLR